MSCSALVFVVFFVPEMFGELVYCEKANKVFILFCAQCYSKFTSPWSSRGITGNSLEVVLCQVAIPMMASMTKYDGLSARCTFCRSVLLDTCIESL